MGLQFFDQYEAPFTYFHQGTATGTVTTNIKAGLGELSLISINQKASAGLCTVYDSLTASGTVIGIFDASSQVNTLFYNVAFKTGLTLSMSAGASTGPDLTVAYV